MTGRERVTAALRGGRPDRVPFAPNIGQWFDWHRTRGSLPPELANCRDELDAMLVLGCDVFSRRLCGVVRTVRSGSETRSRRLEDGGTETEHLTPLGVLRSRSRYTPESHSTYVLEHFVKDARDLGILHHIVEGTDYVCDDGQYRQVDARLGEHGLPMVPFFQSPLKLLHIWAGQEAATFLLLDEPDACRALFGTFTQKVLSLAREAARSSAQVFCTMDNLDSLFHSPMLVREFALPFYQALADVFHGEGKLLFSHACGHILALRELVAEAGLDGLEATPHPPLGDLPLPLARTIHPRFVVNGGMTAHETEVQGPDARDRVFGYVRRVFADMSRERFLFGSACNTSIRTPWENLVHFRDACHEFGCAV
jgi:uroporphyrinogen-III decarboxylase